MTRCKEIIFENLQAVAKSIVETFGRHCEVVIHDFSKLPNSLIYIEGNVTNRSVGAPITDLVLRRLKRDGNSIEDLYNYSTVGRDGRHIKSSTIFVRDNNEQVIGAYCINFDITEYINVSALMDELALTNKSNDIYKKETFASSLNETIDSLMESAIVHFGKHPSLMSKQEKIQFVELLESHGAFLLKGAVEYVAKSLGVTKYTIYNYLKEVRMDNNSNTM